MADLIFVSILVAFFALCVVYLRWCDRIIGPDESRCRSQRHRFLVHGHGRDAGRLLGHRSGGTVIAAAASLDNWIALGIAVAGVLYLFAVLIHPERF